MDDNRQTGRTTIQILEAPKGAYYVSADFSSLNYNAALAEQYGRDDLVMITLEHMRSGYLRGVNASGIVLDHHALHVMENSQYSNEYFNQYYAALASVKSIATKETGSTIMNDDINEALEANISTDVPDERVENSWGKMLQSPILNCYCDPSEDSALIVVMGMTECEDGTTNFDPICAMYGSDYNFETGQLRVPSWFSEQPNPYVFMFVIDSLSVSLSEFVEWMQTDFSDMLNDSFNAWTFPPIYSFRDNLFDTVSDYLEALGFDADSVSVLEQFFGIAAMTDGSCGCDVCQCGDETLAGLETGYDEQVSSAVPTDGTEKVAKFEDTEWVA